MLRFLEMDQRQERQRWYSSLKLRLSRYIPFAKTSPYHDQKSLPKRSHDTFAVARPDQFQGYVLGAVGYGISVFPGFLPRQ